MIHSVTKRRVHFDNSIRDVYSAFVRERGKSCSVFTVIKRIDITNGFPEAGGGGAADSADAEATGGDAAPAEASDDDDGGGDADGEPARRPRPNARRKAAPLPAPSVQPATTATSPLSPLLKLPEVLAALPVSRSSWYSGMRSGLYPQPVKIGAKSVAWRRSDIDRLIDSLAYSN